ncbi:MAG: acyltransferase family protein [Firmicutes bacterium]|nr:acyltransferase family protein [Bacillota bacterium]
MSIDAGNNEQLTVQNKRSPYWDNIKGFLILLVVFAHCLYSLRDDPLNALVVKSIYYFHMPAFVFVSGYFSKSDRSRSAASIMKLVVAYFFIMSPFMVQDLLTGDTVVLIRPLYSAWYILALIIWRLVTPYVAHFKAIMAAIIIFALLVGFWQDISDMTELGIKKVVTFYPFFMAGYLLPQKTVDRYILGKPWWLRAIPGVIIAAAAIVAGYVCMQHFDIRLHDMMPGAYDNWYDISELRNRMIVMAVAFAAIVAIMLLTINKNIPLLTKFGRNSLTIFVVHRMLTLVFSDSSYVTALDAKHQILAAAGTTMAIAIVFGSDLIGGAFDKLMSNCGKSLLPDMEDRRLIKYRVFTLCFIICLFTAPIIKGFYAS